MANELKPMAIEEGYCAHDCETHYRCPVCHKCFGSWRVFHQERNENGTKHYCPYCNTELRGIGVVE